LTPGFRQFPTHEWKFLPDYWQLFLAAGKIGNGNKWPIMLWTVKVVMVLGLG